ncbi:glycosyltransferase family 39 protein [Paraburkholderia caballeronis]|uniref:4-amino-4-deoxy-L-arabinose transferase n=1 Tax=Paraburkholderia caballeronis TaxID=416943 RepID=A0A1H7JR75_9BURK|nr:glycosyltransferase family 39 protein [Paraburkholderia caballeronis]PXW27328.1 4-amino-4-deoxy-L-arabinose transferase-like glycosyltransferase [Paraburkholderia caballeronis]PXX02802.1 4-amino-4-deoxy-L-arabinose transferase-like glycosyltransferase [Paraburkholderia caballeronis]RAK03527.1 4-amino-4-deoxy-L-arabinose transferase-like glycosyltransferase [Paraburkholderia caballeronis]SEC35630.1 4-amino-4-deoxy-L-arabinose transferase [Paraburkholderia caballeronis]SEK76470.1 4-amino-4-de
MNDTPSRLPLNRTALLLLVAALAVIWFVPLGWRHLLPSDEGRYAEMAREMLASGDWITPRYNDYKYFEKPPLQTWANALTFMAFGLGEWQARLYTALTGFAGILLVGFTGARVFNAATGFFAALALACAPYWNLMGHFNTLDMGLSFWMELSLCALLLAQRPGLPSRGVRGWMWVCWAAMALSVLSKGLVGLILPGAVLVLYTLAARDWALWKRLYLVSGLIVFFAIVTPWFVLVQQRNPEFFNFFFVVQQFRRYLTPEQNRPGALYYFVPVLIVGFLPWLSVAFQSFRHALRMPRQPNGFAPVTLLVVWSAFIFVFFSASHSKLISYTLPIAPALALVIGAYLPLMTRAQWQRLLSGYAVFLVVAAFGALFLGRLGDARNPNALYREFQLWVYAALAAGFVLTLVALWLNRRSRDPQTARTGPAIAFGAGWLLLATIAGTGHDVFGTVSSGAPLAPAVRSAIAALPPGTPFYSVGVLDHTIPFYVRHSMIMVQTTDELAFGISQEPQKWVPTIDEWKQRWVASHYALALLPAQRYEQLAADGLPMQVVARDARRVIVERSRP